MENSILLGIRRLMLRIPRSIWQPEVKRSAEAAKKSLAFMTPDHHRVRDFVVREMPRIGEPIKPEQIAEELGIHLDGVISILDDLERNMTFLFRDEQGAVIWAYPVTVAETPHQVTFSSGETIYAAWAIDAIATPFVQGQLKKEYLISKIKTSCAQTGKPIQIEIDSDLKFSVQTEGAEPVLFIPMMNAAKLKEPSIIDAFWVNSVFFWSEEHAKQYRTKNKHIRGTYMNLKQAAFLTPKVQGGLFSFPREA